MREQEQQHSAARKNTHLHGLGRIFKPRWKRKDGSYYESPHWWIAYYYRGKEIRESSESENEAEAKRLLNRKVTAIEAGKVLHREDKLLFDELATEIENDYRVNGKRTLADLSYRIAHLRKSFGLDRATDITTNRARTYQRSDLTKVLRQQPSIENWRHCEECFLLLLTLASFRGFRRLKCWRKTT